MADIVDQHVEPSEPVGDAGAQGLYRRDIAHVALIDQSIGELLTQRRAFARVDLGDRELRADQCEGFGGGLADPGARAGDQGDLALQADLHVALLSVSRSLSWLRPPAKHPRFIFRACGGFASFWQVRAKMRGPRPMQIGISRPPWRAP